MGYCWTVRLAREQVGLFLQVVPTLSYVPENSSAYHDQSSTRSEAASSNGDNGRLRWPNARRQRTIERAGRVLQRLFVQRVGHAAGSTACRMVRLP